MRRNTSLQFIALAACSFGLTAGDEIQLTPAGDFRASDGRPVGIPAWTIDADIAARIIEQATSRSNPFVIDYEHQTLKAEDNGQPAPAAGWFKSLEWRDGVGLFAVGVEWTSRAREMIEAGEYRFISPVFSYDKATGELKKLLMAAITNNPAIDGMDEVSARAAARFSADSSPDGSGAPSSKEIQMDELLEQLRWLLNLPVGSTSEDVAAQLQTLIDQIKQEQGEAAAAGFSLQALLDRNAAEIATLKATAPDPAKFVPVETMQALQRQVSELTGRINERELDELVNAALSNGKLLPAQENWARILGKQNLAALKQYVETAQPIAALSGTQTGGNPPGENAGSNGLTADELTVCRQMGVSEEAFLKTKATSQA